MALLNPDALTFDARTVDHSAFRGDEPAANDAASPAAPHLDVELEFPPPALSEDFIADDFVREYGAWFRWSPGLDWMVNEGTHWERDERLRRYTYARKSCRKVALTSGAKADQQKLARAATVEGALKLARTHKDINASVDSWDADPLLLNTPGGVVDLRTGLLRNRRPDERFTKITRYTPDARAHAPRFMQFLREVFEGDQPLIDYVQAMLGYCATGLHTIHEVYVWFGPTARNGKNTLGDLHLDLLGSYGMDLPTETLLMSGAAQHPQSLARLHTARVAYCSEAAKGAWWNEPRLKKLSGDTYFTAHYMQKNDFQFTLTHKHIILANNLPHLHGNDPALKHRMRVIPFNVSFADPAKMDRALPEKLRREAPGVLAWIVEGARRVATHGMPPMPTAVAEASAQYMEANDEMEEWANECCVRDPRFTAMSGALYENFRAWKDSRHEPAPSLKTWAQDMARLMGGPGVRGKAGVRWQGICPKHEVLVQGGGCRQV
jgi:putative DNA primase/helicase